MNNMLGVFLDLDSLNRNDLDLATLKSVLPGWRFYRHSAPEEVVDRLGGAAVVISNKVALDEKHFLQAQDLRLVCVSATGTDNIDLGAAREQGIDVCNVRGYATPAVTQHVFSLLLALVIRLPDYTRAVREGRWRDSREFCLLDYPVTELAGKTLGIVGYGELGRSVAGIARAFGMTVLVAARPGAAVTGGRLGLPELLPRVDVLSLHCPLAGNTRGLIGERELALMKPGAILINTARGGIVDERALARALRAGRLGGAGVDVLSVEPPREGNPLLARDIPNLIVTPHIAWASREARQRLVNEVALNIRAWLSGQPRNRVSGQDMKGET